ncbi:hypothetical protein DL98DRAFT_519707 [Cadophora sp. DSE1049]|nr:hypothetical protein DL98DRAFT_519707 [Cadophora sp. DSE1049]
MDINDMDQGLLIRNPTLTREEFSHHWYHNHAPLVIPMFLHLGVQHYQQVGRPLHLSDLTTTYFRKNHGPFTTSDPALDILSFDGIAGLPAQEILDAPSSMPAWVQAYYDEVVKKDERRFLVSEALDHIVRVKPRTVKGEVKVVIQEGKPLIEVSDEIWKVWKEYEARGRKE